MALEDDIKKVQQLNAEIKQLYRDLNRTDKPPIFDPNQIRSAQDAIRNLKRDFNEINSELNFIARSFRDTVSEMSKQNTELGKAKSSLKSISSVATEIAYENSKGNLIEDKTLDKLQKRAKLQFESLKIAVLSGDIRGQDLKAARAALKEEEKFFNQLTKIRDQQKEIKKDSGVKLFGGLESITNLIPGLSNFTSAFQEASNAAEKQAKFNLQSFGFTKGMSKEKLNQEKARVKEENSKIASAKRDLKFGNNLNEARLKQLEEQGFLEAKNFKDKNGNFLSGNAASARAMKLGIVDSLKPLSDPKNVTPLQAGFKALGPILKKSLGPLALLSMLVQTLLEADKATGDLAKSMNMTYSEANAVRMELNEVANLSMDAFVTTKGLQESFSFINSQLGSNVMLSGKLLTQFTKLREASGLTNEELYGATQLQLTSNKTLNEVTGEIMAQAKLTAKNNGVILDEKQILKEIKDVSAATTLSLGKNPSAIADAVTQAKALGMTLGQVEKIAEGLLNFESSITSELKAELLLGRDINLERARLFALNNNIAGVAKEISSQIGNSADFARMNVLQQKALAEAVGMNREELAKTLFVQENLGAATGDAADKRKSILNSLIREKGLEEAKRILGKKSIEDLENQASIQDRFNQSVLKLKEIFVSLAGPILQIISPFVDLITTILPAVNFLLTPIIAGVNIIAEGFRYISDSVKSLFGVLTGSNEQLTLMQGIVGTIASIYLAIKGYALTTKILQGASLAIEAARGGFAQKRLLLESQGLIKQVGSAIFSVISSFSKIPFGVGVGLGLVAAAGIASMASKYLKGDDIMSPGAGSGYGSRTLMGPEGAIALNNKDTVIAGTDLFNSSNSSPTPMTTPINQNQNTSMEVSQLKAENAAIKQESKKTNNLLENLISATKANKTVEMDDPFGALYTV